MKILHSCLLTVCMVLLALWSIGCGSNGSDNPFSSAQETSGKLTVSTMDDSTEVGTAADGVEEANDAEGGDEEDEEEVAVADLPEVVVAAVLEAVPGGQIDEAERSLENGVVVYEVDVSTVDGETEVEVGEDGTILDIEIDDEDDDEDDDDD
ncbi:MAG: hypothetical protein GKR89_15595 [Candidatus Latescibacteria bacterium]|nr:hypothetical protein [Candidatus Latescibacterota bacterium]